MIFALGLLSAALAAQQQAPVFRTEAKLVEVTVTVLDKKGNAVTGLTQSDFVLQDGGIARPIAFFRFDGLPPQPAQAPRMAPGFFTNRANEGGAFGPKHRYSGASPVHDSIYYAASDKLRNTEGRKALVLISDGKDTCSRKSVSDVIEMLQASDTVFYALNPGMAAQVKILAPMAMLFRSHLDRIAQEAGGAEFKLKQVPLEDAFRRIEEELRTSYSIAYVSSRPERDGSFRKIEIRTSQPGLTVRARAGYRARAVE